jgi:hypothetical protein
MRPPATGDDDGDDVPRPLNRLAVVGLVVGGVTGVAGVFALPTLRSQGLSFEAAMVVVAVTEFSAALLAGYSAMRLYGAAEAAEG